MTPGELVSRIKSIKGLPYLAVAIAFGILLIVSGGRMNVKRETAPAAPVADNTEERLTAIISDMYGVSNVRLMITYEDAGENVYVQNTSGASSSCVVVEGEAGSEVPVLKAELKPKVRGAAVVCSGGDNPAIQMKIISLLSALLDLPSNRIFVTGSD